MVDGYKHDDLTTAWSARFSNVERLDDPEEDATFAVDFAMEGLGANGSLTVLVGNLGEDKIIAEAVERLREALEAWTKALAEKDSAGAAEG